MEHIAFTDALDAAGRSGFGGYHVSDYTISDTKSKFMHRTAAWLDFTSPLCGKTIGVISNLHFCMMANGAKKPVAITVMGCRDAHHSTAERVAAIKAAQPALDIVDAWTYIGKGGVSMLTVCGLIV